MSSNKITLAVQPIESSSLDSPSEPSPPAPPLPRVSPNILKRGDLLGGFFFLKA